MNEGAKLKFKIREIRTGMEQQRLLNPVKVELSTGLIVKFYENVK